MLEIFGVILIWFFDKMINPLLKMYRTIHPGSPILALRPYRSPAK